jgi:hypothetical protein
MKKTILLAMTVLLLSLEIAFAQSRPRPSPRPQWPDVCCGGPCCSKPQRPGR